MRMDMLQKTILNIHFYYRENTCLIGASVNFEFTYDAPAQINILDKMKDVLGPNHIAVIKENCGELGVEEVDILTVLNALISIKQMCNASITASPSKKFQTILTKGLEKNGGNSIDNLQFYLNNIPPVLSINERIEPAITQKNFVEAFALAQHYRAQFLQNYLIKTRGYERCKVVSMNIDATEWLALGLEFIKDTNHDLRHYVNLDEFLNPLDHIRRQILHCDANSADLQLLLDALIENKTIKAVIIEKEADLSNFLYALLKSTTSINKLIISMDVNQELSAQFIERLAEILKVNMSIDEVDFKSGRTIKIEDLQTILNALAVNPNSKLTDLTGQRVAINSDNKAELLIHHLQQHNKLEYVKHWHYLVISLENFNTINRLLSENKEKKYKIERAFVKGSAQGFFSQLGMTKDLGDAMAPYITKKDAFNLIQVAKLSAQKAKNVSEDMIKQINFKK